MQFLVLSLGTVVCKLLSLRNTEYSFHEPVPALLQFRVNRLSAFQYSWCAYQKWMTRLSLSVNLHTDENLYPFGFSAGDSRLFRTDDGSSSAIFLFSRFRFFGTSEFTLYVSWLHLYFTKVGHLTTCKQPDHMSAILPHGQFWVGFCSPAQKLLLPMGYIPPIFGTYHIYSSKTRAN